MTSDPVPGLRDRITEAGGVLVDSFDRDGFAQERYRIGELLVVLDSDYGRWRANLSFGGQQLQPASFWLAALDGHDSVPYPEVTDEDLGRLEERLPDLVASAERLAPQVKAMGDRSEQAMRAELGDWHA